MGRKRGAAFAAAAAMVAAYIAAAAPAGATATFAVRSVGQPGAEPTLGVLSNGTVCIRR